MNASPFPPLPSELLLHILCLACAHKQTLLSLSLVSSWTHELTVSYLFHTVSLTTARQIHTFLQILPLHLPEWWAKRVKNLWITYPDPGRLCAPIFKLCRGTTNIALQSNLLHLRNDPVYSLAQLLERCAELTLIGPTFPSDFEDPTLFDNITHFRLIEPLSGPWYTGGQISKMQRLTHIVVPFQEPKGYAGEMFEEVKQILESPSLEVIVLQMDQRNWAKTSSGASNICRSIGEWRSFAWHRDPRLRVIEDHGSGFGHGEWEEATRGGESVWERAAREHEEWQREGLRDQDLELPTGQFVDLAITYQD